jgi:3-deoxy-D-manno-octulosonic-acid transferase
MASSERLLEAGWTAALLGASLAASPWFALKLATDQRWRDGVKERFGGWPESDGLLPGGWFWVHAASVGEVRMALRLMEALEGGPSGAPVRATAFTPAGRIAAREARPGSCYAPLDLPWIVDRRTATLPRAYIALETELWPNLLLSLRRRAVPAFIVSARLSERSFGRYRRLGRCGKTVLGTLAGVMARDAESAARYVDLGCPPEKVQVTGDLKLDLPVPVPTAPAARFPAPRSVLAAASVHPGEEGPLLDFFSRMLPGRPEFTLLLAPRHLDRIPWFLDRLAERGLPVLRHSIARETGGDAAGRVYLLDTLGELPGLYHLAGAVFVGGTLVPVGGHNLMEPALAGKGVLFGPHIASVAGMAALLTARGGGIATRDGASLVTVLGEIFADDAGRAELSRGAERAAALGAGALNRTVAALRAALGAP